VESLAATGWVHEPQGEALTPKFSAFSADTKEYRALTVDRDSALAEFDRQRLGCFGGPILPAGGNNAP
jgi:hypothetical protein